MTDRQWEALLIVLDGEILSPPPMGFIIDSPWLPHWAGTSILDYYTSDEIWLEANLRAAAAFPELTFLPGFWAEYGMCTEPSAFGARCSFPPDEFPFAHPVIRTSEDIDALEIPDPETDGLAPFVLARLRRARPRIEAAGHKIRFSVSRGPLNVASFLMGVDAFLTALVTEPERAARLLGAITDYLVRWHEIQRAAFPTIDGMLVLDDIVGFVGRAHFETFARPHLARLFAPPVRVKFFHNDADARISAPALADLGVNLFNMGSDIPLGEWRRLAGDRVTLLGNIPPRDVLAEGTPDDVHAAVRGLVGSLADRRRIIFSCGGGMPPGVRNENIQAFNEAVKKIS
jgi:uroporphyrinogen-III decarboxylase